MRHFMLLSALVLLIGAGGSFADQRESRVDGSGDPLPDGAVMRLGTTRLRERQGVEGLAFTPDGKMLASCGWSESIRFWDVTSGQLMRRFRTDEGDSTFAVAFSPDGLKMASVGESGWVRLWDVATGKALIQVKAHKDRTYGVAFAPDGKTFATAGGDGTVRRWNVATGAQISQFQAPADAVDAHAVAISPDGRWLASAYGGRRNAAIRIWNLQAGGEPREVSYPAMPISLAFLPDGKTLVSSGTRDERRKDADGKSRYTQVSQIDLWSVEKGEFVREFLSEEDLLGDCSIAVSRDGSRLVSAHHDRLVIWKMPTGKALRTLKANTSQYGGRSHGVAISPDGRIVASKAFSHKIWMWNAETGEELFPQRDANTDTVLSVAASPDGKWFATGSGDKTVKLWDAATGRVVREISAGTGWVRSVSFSVDGKLVVVGAEAYHQDKTPSYQGEVKLCQTDTGSVVRSFSVDNRVMCATLSNDGKQLAAASGLGFSPTDESPECRISVWDLTTDDESVWLAGHTGQIDLLQFARDDKTLFSASQDATFRLWDLEAASEPQKISLPERSSVIACSPDASILVVNCVQEEGNRRSSRKIYALKRDGGKRLWELKMPDVWSNAGTVSPDGRVLAIFTSGLARPEQKAGPGSIRLLNLMTGKELQSFPLDDGEVVALSFSADGRRLLSGMQAGDTLVWDCSATASKRDERKTE